MRRPRWQARSDSADSAIRLLGCCSSDGGGCDGDRCYSGSCCDSCDRSLSDESLQRAHDDGRRSGSAAESAERGAEARRGQRTAEDHEAVSTEQNTDSEEGSARERGRGSMWRSVAFDHRLPVRFSAHRCNSVRCSVPVEDEHHFDVVLFMG